MLADCIQALSTDLLPPIHLPCTDPRSRARLRSVASPFTSTACRLRKGPELDSAEQVSRRRLKTLETKPRRQISLQRSQARHDAGARTVRKPYGRFDGHSIPVAFTIPPTGSRSWALPAPRRISRTLTAASRRSETSAARTSQRASHGNGASTEPSSAMGCDGSRVSAIPQQRRERPRPALSMHRDRPGPAIDTRLDRNTKYNGPRAEPRYAKYVTDSNLDLGVSSRSDPETRCGPNGLEGGRLHARSQRGSWECARRIARCRSVADETSNPLRSSGRMVPLVRNRHSSPEQAPQARRTRSVSADGDRSIVAIPRSASRTRRRFPRCRVGEPTSRGSRHVRTRVLRSRVGSRMRRSPDARIKDDVYRDPDFRARLGAGAGHEMGTKEISLEVC
jgi:hypothetical protein